MKQVRILPEARTYDAEVIDNFRNNWWCELKNARFGETNYSWGYDDPSRPKQQPIPLRFLSAEQQQQAAREWQELVELGSGPDFPDLARNCMGTAASGRQART